MLDWTDDGMKNMLVSTGREAEGGKVSAWNDVPTNAPDGLHTCPVLHSLPALAAVSASLQQSPTETECSIAIAGIPCFIEQGCLNACAYAMPWKATVRHRKRENNARTD